MNFSVSLSRAHCKLHVVVTCLYIFCLQVVAGGPSGPAIMRSTDSYSLTSRSGDIKLFYKLPFLFCGLKKNMSFELGRRSFNSFYGCNLNSIAGPDRFQSAPGPGYTAPDAKGTFRFFKYFYTLQNKP